MLVRSYGAIAPAKVTGNKVASVAVAQTTPKPQVTVPAVAKKPGAMTASAPAVASTSAKPVTSQVVNASPFAKASVKAAPQSAVQQAKPLATAPFAPAISQVSTKPTTSASALPSGVTSSPGTMSVPSGVTSVPVSSMSTPTGASVIKPPVISTTALKPVVQPTNLYAPAAQPSSAPSIVMQQQPSATPQVTSISTTPAMPSVLKPSAGPAMSTSAAPSSFAVSPTANLAQQDQGVLVPAGATALKPSIPTTSKPEIPAIPVKPSVEVNKPESVSAAASPLDSIASTGGNVSSLPGESMKAEVQAAQAAPPVEAGGFFTPGKIAVGVGVLLGLAYAASRR